MKTFEMILGGHPDKVCDIIAEEIKKEVKGGKSAVEVCWFNDTITVGGEVSCVFSLGTVKNIVKKVLLDLDYYEDIKVVSHLQTQSKEIADIVKENGAGDNGVFFAGWDLVWSPVVKKLKTIAKVLTKHAKLYNYRTDGKFIATFADDRCLYFTLNIASDEKQTEQNKRDFSEYLTQLIGFTFDNMATININPKGDWFKCGGFADSGLTGRKLACDNSMGLFHQGGGAFFGKDVSKADYSVPLYLQNIAKCDALIRNSSAELSAHTIIGDEEVEIFDEVRFLRTAKFSEIKKYAEENPMDWTGL